MTSNGLNQTDGSKRVKAYVPSGAKFNFGGGDMCPPDTEYDAIMLDPKVVQNYAKIIYSQKKKKEEAKVDKEAKVKKDNTASTVPNYSVDEEKIPKVFIKSIRFQNFKAFEDYTFDFLEDGEPKYFACLFGPNGCGKTTVLETIQTMFSSFEGWDKERLTVNLSKSVRHGKDDFLVTAIIGVGDESYTLKINKLGFVEGYDHPSHVKEFLSRIYYSARFDQELHQFQLERDKWPVFKKLFESVTGFTIEESNGVFTMSEDPVQQEILKKYVLSFDVTKPDEIITHRECSAGEKKIIKSFSTLLNKEYKPQIILIDNVAMHVESGRHLELIRCIKECFPDSQIFTTTHSHNISKNFGKRTELYDLRKIKATGLFKDEPWRIYLTDEVNDNILKLKSLKQDENVKSFVLEGYDILSRLEEDLDGDKLTKDTISFIQKIVGLYLNDTVLYYGMNVTGF